MKKIIRKIYNYLFYVYVPYMRIGRRKVHLFLLKFNSKKVGKNLNFHYGVVFQGTKNTTFGDDIDIGRFSYLSLGGKSAKLETM